MLKVLSRFFPEPVARNGDAFANRPAAPDLGAEIAAAARHLCATRQRFALALRGAEGAGGVPAELREAVAAASAKLTALSRERRIAEATAAVRRLRGGCALSPGRRRALAEAEAVLARLCERGLAAESAAKARAIVAVAAASRDSGPDVAVKPAGG